ncbi:hypothetical protein Hanom_Chr11g00984971 [Helianthus anomalus]
MLLRAPCADPRADGPGWALFRKLEYEVKHNFPYMKYAKTYLKRAPGVRNPDTGKPMKTVIWPPTQKDKRISLSKKFTKGCLKNLKFWLYDENMGEAILACDDNTNILADPNDLISFYQEVLEVLARNQILSTNTYEVCAKMWTNDVANIMISRLSVDATTAIDAIGSGVGDGGS